MAHYVLKATEINKNNWYYSSDSSSVLTQKLPKNIFKINNPLP